MHYAKMETTKTNQQKSNQKEKQNRIKSLNQPLHAIPHS